MEGRRLTRTAGLLPAAGAGTRLGLGPKAFLKLDGRPLLLHGVSLLKACCDEVLVAVPAERVEEARALVPEVHVIAGGETRQETVARLAGATSAAYVVIHDAARPLTPMRVMHSVLEAAQRTGASSAAIPVADTLHDLRDEKPVDREHLRAIQTPQAFLRSLLLEAHAAATELRRVGTDDAQLVRALGHVVELVDGSPWSHKITHPSDLAWAEALVKANPE